MINLFSLPVVLYSGSKGSKELKKTNICGFKSTESEIGHSKLYGIKFLSVFYKFSSQPAHAINDIYFYRHPQLISSRVLSKVSFS